jgi:hypothetical protein
MPEVKGTAHARRKRRGRLVRSVEPAVKTAFLSGIKECRYFPLDDSDSGKIDLAVRKILQQIGMVAAPPIVSESGNSAINQVRFDKV